MEKNKIEEIYEIMIESLPLTKETLLNNNFTIEEINKILEEGILIEEKPNEYSLCCIYELYYYGLKLITKQEIKKANICFKLCYKLRPNDRVFLLQELLLSLKLGHYYDAFENFSVMEKIESDKYQADNNLYLYLLSILTGCKKEYLDRLRNLEYDSVLYKEEDEIYNKKTLNDIRNSIMKDKFGYALEKLNTLMINEPIRLVELEVLKELLLQVMRAETKFKLKLLNFAKEKDYQNIFIFLRNKSKKRYLSNKDTYIYLITKAIIELNDTKRVSEITIPRPKTLYDAIKGNNFKTAKYLNNKAIKREHNTLDNQIITILLNDINLLIESIKNENVKKENNEEEKTVSNSNETNQVADIKALEDLAYWYKEQHLTLEDALTIKQINIEQYLLMKLIYARDCYTDELYLYGDKLLKEVEKNPNKTNTVINFLNEVRTNKKFYKNRIKTHKKIKTPNN